LIGAQRVDFIAVPTRDRARAAQFYGETLGLERNPNSTDTWIEFETGNVTQSVVLRVPDVDDSKTRLREAGVEFVGETFDSGVCNGATCSSSTVATPRKVRRDQG
jgi:hypothetical protein